jgi:hypothetical protein
MPSLTYDGRSFLLDGRRIWIVSAVIHFQRHCREVWADRIHAARLAGFNTVEIPVCWARLEPRPGQFDFAAENDLRHFVELVRDAGMHAILRPGPYIGAAWDLGGLPSWLLDIPEVQLRTANAHFLEAVSRYFTALSGQVRDLQIASGGPIVLIQTETDWCCGDDELAEQYLGELTRYLRESGLNATRMNANNLWAGVEGEVDAWAGAGDMLAVSRQLSIVKPDQPKLFADFGPKPRPVFGQEPVGPLSGVELQRRLAQILAGGGQFSLGPFACGTSFGFGAGQMPFGEHTMLAPPQVLGAPLDEMGRPGESFQHVRRIASFASSFGKVFAHLDPSHAPIALDPSADLHHSGKRGKNSPPASGWSVVHASGAQGSVVFLFAPGGEPTPQTVSLLMPDGITHQVSTGGQAVYWTLFDVHLSGRTTLDVCTLCPLAATADLLVVFGPAGGRGLVTINGSPLEVTVPGGKRPLVEVHEGVTVAVFSEEGVDEALLNGDGIYFGVRTLARDGQPVPTGDAKSCTKITSGGKTANVPGRAHTPPKLPKSGAVTLRDWSAAPASEQVDGSSPRYAQIPGPAELTKLGAPYGYGWYRLSFTSGSARKLTVGAPDSADRLHVFVDGEHAGVLGRGPIAASTTPVSLKKGSRTVVVLADNMGRFAGGSDMGERRGLLGHLWELGAFKLGKPKVEEGAPRDPLSFRKPLFQIRKGDATSPMRVGWNFQHRKKSPLFFESGPMPHRALVLLNDEPVRFVDEGRCLRLTLDEDRGLKRGGNTLQLAFLLETHDLPSAEEAAKAAAATLATTFHAFEGKSAITEKAEWAFAKWEPPAPAQFDPVAKSALGKHKIPTWWRTTFDAVRSEDAPLVLDLSGLTKGQVYLNGRHIGRYFVATPTGAKVPPVQTMSLPGPWLEEQDNELMIFDEHGGNPGRVKLVYAV